VALDTMTQMQQHLLLRKYDGFMKKGRVRFRGAPGRRRRGVLTPPRAPRARRARRPPGVPPAGGAGRRSAAGVRAPPAFRPSRLPLARPWSLWLFGKPAPW
jgi:hypothetical protein